MTVAFEQVAYQPVVVPELLDLIAHTDPSTQALAIGELSRAAEQSTPQPRLVKLVEDVGPERLAETLHKIIQSDALGWRWGMALSALGSLGRWNPCMLDRLIDVLHDDDRHVRAAAVGNLVKVGQSSGERRVAVREALLGMLSQPGGEDKDEPGNAASSAYEALWALEVR